MGAFAGAVHAIVCGDAHAREREDTAHALPGGKSTGLWGEGAGLYVKSGVGRKQISGDRFVAPVVLLDRVKMTTERVRVR
jgi:hypothetical protein